MKWIEFKLKKPIVLEAGRGYSLNIETGEIKENHREENHFIKG
jgi:hypothetical protein